MIREAARLKLSAEFMDKGPYLGDDVRLCAEHEEQLVEEVEEQTLEIVGLGLYVMDLLDLHAVQVRHVAEHGHSALLESFLHRVTP